jgi:alpha-mannosidase
MDRYSDGGIKRARITFLARDIPALGYSTYHVVPGLSAPGPKENIRGAKDTNVIESTQYRVTFNLATGEMTSLFDKSSQWEVLAGPANVVSRQQDKGDLWELYRGLDGGS